MFHTPYSDSRPRPKTDCQAAAKKSTQDLPAKQEFADSCDINQIIARAQKNGAALPPLPQALQEHYPDLSGPQTFLEALDLVERAEAAFLSLPASVRAECDNRPDIFLGKIQDPSWAKSHGLLEEPPVAAGQAAPAAAPAPSEGAGAAKTSGTA